MHAKMVTLTEAARNFSDYVSRVAYRNEMFVLCKGKKPIAELRPLPRGRRLGDLPGILRALPRLSKADAEDFAADVATAREAQAVAETRDPWAS